MFSRISSASAFAFSRNIWRAFLALGLACASLSAAHAHLVFFELTPDKSIVVKFGDYLEKTEVSPGRLDVIPETPAFTIAPDGAVTFAKATRGAESIAYDKAVAAADKPLFLDIELPVRPPKDANTAPSRSIYHARYSAGAPTGPAAEPKLDLDIIPGADGKFTVYFRGKPLPETKVNIHEPDNKTQDITTDKDGSFTFKAKTGLTLLSTRNKEEATGYYKGSVYKSTGHIAILSLSTP